MGFQDSEDFNEILGFSERSDGFQDVEKEVGKDYKEKMLMTLKVISSRSEH